MPSGQMSNILTDLSAIIASLPSFAAQCAIDGLTPANQIYWHAVRPDAEGDVVTQTYIDRPLIVLKPVKDQWRAYDSQGMQSTKTIRMHINDKYREDSFKDAMEAFTDFYGTLIDELTAKQGIDTNTAINTADMAQEPWATERRDKSETFGFIAVEYDIDIGNDFE